MTRWSGLGIAALLALSASGCFDLSDSRGPVMSVELCWDETPGAGFDSKKCVNTSRSTCESAGVDRMSYSLKLDGKEKASMEEDCVNGIDFLEPTPGEYTLSVTGTNKDGEMLWEHTCKGLVVLRFDISYECDIDAP